MANNTKFAKVIREAEAKINADAEGVRAELAKAVSDLPALEQKVQDLKDDLGAEAEVKSRIKRGEDVPALDLVVAKAEDEIAEYRLKTAKGRAAALEGRLPAPSTVMADRIVPAINAVLPGVEVITTVAPLTTWKNDIPENTVAVVVYAEPKIETDPFTGVKSGHVRAYFIRTGLMRPISVAALEAAGQAKRTALSVKSNSIADEGGWVTVAGTPESGNESDPSSMQIDSLAIYVTGVMDGLPVIAKIGNGVSGPAKELTRRVLGGYQKPGIISAVRLIETDTDEHTAFRFTMGATAAFATNPVVSEEIDGNERTLTVRQVVNLSGANPSDFVEESSRIAETFIGAVVVGNGLLTDVEVSARAGRLDSTYSVEVVATYKSLVA